jgi:hypothetical protein
MNMQILYTSAINLKGSITHLYNVIEEFKKLGATHYEIKREQGPVFVETYITAYKERTEREILEAKMKQLKKELNEALQEVNILLKKINNE